MPHDIIILRANLSFARSKLGKKNEKAHMMKWVSCKENERGM
jgi:hypothetical protein